MTSLCLVVCAVGCGVNRDALLLDDRLALLEARPHPLRDAADAAGIFRGHCARYGLPPRIEFLSGRLEAFDAVLAEQELDVFLEIGELPEERLRSELLGRFLAQRGHRPAEVVVQPDDPLDQQ